MDVQDNGHDDDENLENLLVDLSQEERYFSSSGYQHRAFDHKQYRDRLRNELVSNIFDGFSGMNTFTYTDPLLLYHELRKDKRRVIDTMMQRVKRLDCLQDMVLLFGDDQFEDQDIHLGRLFWRMIAHNYHEDDLVLNSPFYQGIKQWLFDQPTDSVMVERIMKNTRRGRDNDKLYQDLYFFVEQNPEPLPLSQSPTADSYDQREDLPGPEETWSVFQEHYGHCDEFQLAQENPALHKAMKKNGSLKRISQNKERTQKKDTPAKPGPEESWAKYQTKHKGTLGRHELFKADQPLYQEMRVNGSLKRIPRRDGK